MYPAIVFWALSSLAQAVPVPRQDAVSTQTVSINSPRSSPASIRISRRTDQSWMSEGSAGFIDIMMPVTESSASERVASIVLSASSTTAMDDDDNDEKPLSFILNASNTTRTRVYLVTSNSSSSTTLASEDSDESVLEVFLKFPIFDAQSANTVAYCATFDPKSLAASTSISVEKCKDPNSDVSCQTFTYNTTSGVVSPKWVDDTLDRSRVEIQSNYSTSLADSVNSSNLTNISNSTDIFNSTSPDLLPASPVSNSTTLPTDSPKVPSSTSSNSDSDSDSDSDASEPYDDGMYHPDSTYDDGMYHSQGSKRDVKVTSETLIGEDQDAVVLVFTPLNFTEVVADPTLVNPPTPWPTSSDHPYKSEPLPSESSMPDSSESSYPSPTGVERMDNPPISSKSATVSSQDPQRSTKACNKRKSKHPRQSSMSPPIARVDKASSNSTRLDKDTLPVGSDEDTVTSSSLEAKPTVEWFIEAPPGSPTVKATATATVPSK